MVRLRRCLFYGTLNRCGARRVVRFGGHRTVAPWRPTTEADERTAERRRARNTRRRSRRPALPLALLRRSELYLARTFGVRECFTDPHLVYREAKARGMTHVTLTDHDTIAGALQLVDYPDFTIGEEVSAFFPTEALHVHVLVWA